MQVIPHPLTPPPGSYALRADVVDHICANLSSLNARLNLKRAILRSRCEGAYFSLGEEQASNRAYELENYAPLRLKNSTLDKPWSAQTAPTLARPHAKKGLSTGTHGRPAIGRHDKIADDALIQWEPFHTIR